MFLKVFTWRSYQNNSYFSVLGLWALDAAMINVYRVCQFETKGDQVDLNFIYFLSFVTSLANKLSNVCPAT